MTEAWEEALDHLCYAFQPIALSSKGQAYGYEALLRGWREAGFYSIESVFDSAYLDQALPELDARLRSKAFADFAAWAPGGTKLFYNVDNRIFISADHAMGETGGIAKGFGLASSRIVLEISERHELEGTLGFERVISICREEGFRIAIDDFGSGFAGLKLLHMSEPDIVKIDRHFVAGSGGEPRKAAFLAKIVGMAHLMGVPVVAEGVETEAELSICLEAGCDMIQGFLLARPTVGERGFQTEFPAISGSRAESRRGRSRESAITPSSVRLVEPIDAAQGFLQVLSRFRKEPDLDILPVIDESREPIGVYYERDFRQYVYSPYGIALLEHLESETGASAFMHKAPIAAMDSDLARVLEVFCAIPSSGGVIVTRDSLYAGLLPATELLSLVAERELSEARDQNPLTRLPGNLRVAEVIARRMEDKSRGRAFVYFDFDDFKPFNDRYGFRLGDRVIQLFADILRSVFTASDSFIGHLGGDDFFAFGFAASIEESLVPISEASERFRYEAASYYSAEDRERGWILGRSRSGEERRMSLIGVSAALVFMAGGASLDAESLSEQFAALKKIAKRSSTHIAMRAIEGQLSMRAAGNAGPAFAVFAPALRFSPSL